MNVLLDLGFHSMSRGAHGKQFWTWMLGEGCAAQGGPSPRMVFEGIETLLLVHTAVRLIHADGGCALIDDPREK